MKDWQQLLALEWEGIKNQYGPNSHAVVSAFNVLNEIPWLERIGKPIPKSADIVVVKSWDEVIAEFEEDSEQYDISGHLRIPAERCTAVVEKQPYRGWWERAVSDSYDYYTYEAYIPSSLDSYIQEWLNNYLYQYISYLLAEIVAADKVETTYFRSLLPWFLEGHLPCGWEGEWPQDRLRIF